MRTVWPDYGNCIANLPNSILRYFGAATVGDTLPLMDSYLGREYRNVVLLLLDGMGKCVLEEQLSPGGPFRTHLAGIYSSVFLSTTVAATTSVLSGLQPCEHSWLGWDCYYPQLDRNVTVFTNTLQGSEEPAADFHVAGTFTPYVNIISRINEAGRAGSTEVKAYGVTPFLPPNPKSLEEICNETERLCAQPGRKYIYAYWNQPDGLLHRYGSKAAVVTETMRQMEALVAGLAERLEDTLFIVTADHGHIDNEYAVLQDYPKICGCLERMPSLEPRVLNFFVREGMEKIFENEFTKEFGEKFILMPMEEALRRKLFGTGKQHECFRGMLGNYLAIAADNLSIFFNDERWLSMHGSITDREMEIPLVVFK